MVRTKSILTMEEKSIKYEENKEKHRKLTKNWIENNKERYAEIVKTYCDKNRELINLKSRAYQRERYKKIKERTQLANQNDDSAIIQSGVV